jgi:hypothetical protein
VILLELSDVEASAVAVALVTLIHSSDIGDDHWRFAASDVGQLLDALRREVEREEPP